MTRQSLRFCVLGDSLAAGVGCQRPEQTPGSLLAAAPRSVGHQVDLRVHTVPRARSTALAAQVRAALATGADLALIIIGANDLTALLPPAHGAQLLHDAVADLRAAGAEVASGPGHVCSRYALVGVRMSRAVATATQVAVATSSSPVISNRMSSGG